VLVRVIVEVKESSTKPVEELAVIVKSPTSTAINVEFVTEVVPPAVPIRVTA